MTARGATERSVYFPGDASVKPLPRFRGPGTVTVLGAQEIFATYKSLRKNSWGPGYIPWGSGSRAQVKWGEVAAMGGAAGAVHRGGARKTVSAPLGKLPLYERL